MNDEDNILGLIRENVSVRERGITLENAKLAKHAIAMAGAFAEINVDMAKIADPTSYPNGLEFNTSGFGLLVSQFGSQANARVKLAFDAEPFLTSVGPGRYFRGRFQKLIIKADDDSVAYGNLKLIVIKHPQFDVGELLNAAAVGTLRQASYAPGYNVTTNVPALATDGIDITNCKGVRATVELSSSTINGGVFVFWYYDPVTAKWYESPVQETIVTGRIRAVSSDQLVTAGFGRCYVEVRSITAAAGTPTVAAILTVA